MKIAPSMMAVCAATALVGNAWAQQQSPSSTDSQSRQSSPPAPASGQRAQQSPELSQAQAQEFFRASKLVGKQAQTQNGQKLGKIQDIVFNQQGQIFALVDMGNNRWAAVPWQVANPASAKGDQNLVLNTTQQALKNAPIVTEDQWGALNNPNFTKGVYSYFNVQQPTAMGGGGDQGASGQMQGQGASGDSSQSQDQQDQQRQQQQQNQQTPR